MLCCKARLHGLVEALGGTLRLRGAHAQAVACGRSRAATSSRLRGALPRRCQQARALGVLRGGGRGRLQAGEAALHGARGGAEAGACEGTGSRTAGVGAAGSVANGSRGGLLGGRQDGRV